MGETRIDVTEDGQVQVVERFISDRILKSLTRAESADLARRILEAQRQKRGGR